MRPDKKYRNNYNVVFSVGLNVEILSWLRSCWCMTRNSRTSFRRCWAVKVKETNVGLELCNKAQRRGLLTETVTYFPPITTSFYYSSRLHKRSTKITFAVRNWISRLKPFSKMTLKIREFFWGFFLSSVLYVVTRSSLDGKLAGIVNPPLLTPSYLSCNGAVYDLQVSHDSLILKAFTVNQLVFYFESPVGAALVVYKLQLYINAENQFTSSKWTYGGTLAFEGSDSIVCSLFSSPMYSCVWFGSPLRFRLIRPLMKY